MTEQTLKAIGMKFRKARQLSGLTLEIVASQAEVTKGYLSKIESGRATPSIAVISKLVDVYGMSLSDIFTPEGERTSVSLVRANERNQITKMGTELGYIFELVPLTKLHARAEVFFLTIPVLENKDPVKFRHSGEEINLILEGNMQFKYGGLEFDMGPGDIIQFDPGIEHMGIAIGDEPVKLLVITIHDKSEPSPIPKF